MVISCLSLSQITESILLNFYVQSEPIVFHYYNNSLQINLFYKNGLCDWIGQFFVQQMAWLLLQECLREWGLCKKDIFSRNGINSKENLMCMCFGVREQNHPLMFNEHFDVVEDVTFFLVENQWYKNFKETDSVVHLPRRGKSSEKKSTVEHFK